MLRILLIDDNPNDRLIATRELKQTFSDLEVQAIGDPKSLEQALAEGSFDAVVTDYRLLWSDGLKVLAAVKALYPECPVVMFTDSGSEEVAVAGMKSGLSDYVLKGRQIHRLSIAVRESLAKQKLQQDYDTAIKELQASEETLRFALEAGNAIAYIWTIATNKVRRLSHTRLASQSEPTEPVESTFEQVLSTVHPDDRHHFQTCIQAALDGGPYKTEFRTVQPDGSIIWIYDRGQVIFDELGQPIRLVGVATDITDRKRIEQEQARLLESEQAARTAAETANRVKDEFLATLSHELRSPLNAILGWSQLLRARKLDEATTANALETIERNAKLQAQLIEDLLDISRIIRGKLRLNIAPLNLKDPIEAAIATMRPAAEAKAIQLQTWLDSDTGVIAGDASRLQQIFWNLLSNAIKFTPAGGHVEVRLEPVKDEPTGDSNPQQHEIEDGISAHSKPSYAQVIVSDNGQGISPEFLPYVFDSFRQADASTTRKHNGLGLGLAIVHRLVELHGGTISVASAGTGQGATFTLRLPIRREASEPLSH